MLALIASPLHVTSAIRVQFGFNPRDLNQINITMMCVYLGPTHSTGFLRMYVMLIGACRRMLLARMDWDYRCMFNSSAYTNCGTSFSCRHASMIRSDRHSILYRPPRIIEGPAPDFTRALSLCMMKPCTVQAGMHNAAVHFALYVCKCSSRALVCMTVTVGGAFILY